MTMQQNREASELVLCYAHLDGRLVRIFLPLLFGTFAAGGLWLVCLWVTELPSATLPVVLVGLALCPGTFLLSWLTIRLAAVGRRSARGDWWLRLLPGGCEVNDGTFAPRRYEWREIEKFMLVGPWGEVEDVVVAHGKTFAEASRDGDTQAPVRVGFRYSPGHRRTVANKLLGGLRRRAKTKADGFVMGYWDRSFNEAVELMNEWLTRYKTA